MKGVLLGLNVFKILGFAIAFVAIIVGINIIMTLISGAGNTNVNLFT